jgi:hypothetical protein
MAAEPNFTGFSAPSVDAVRADSYMVSILGIYRWYWSSECRGCTHRAALTFSFSRANLSSTTYLDHLFPPTNLSPPSSRKFYRAHHLPREFPKTTFPPPDPPARLQVSAFKPS